MAVSSWADGLDAVLDVGDAHSDTALPSSALTVRSIVCIVMASCAGKLGVPPCHSTKPKAITYMLDIAHIDVSRLSNPLSIPVMEAETSG
ncbi:hypothetical protein Tamer19_06820 [Cupriavidus sp. TA19]|nr:hypothetical protein Tamer19_06820 [Cupriavidus sp. TA19]